MTLNLLDPYPLFTTPYSLLPTPFDPRCRILHQDSP